jgi:hypothetical protein
MTVAPVAEHTETPESKAETPSFHERLESVADDFLSKAGAEEPAPTDAAADGTEASQAGDEQKTEADATTADTWVEPTPEQLSDTAWWGALSKDGWARMERDHPVVVHHVKAGQAAGTRYLNDKRLEADRILNEARATATTHPRTDAQDDEEPSPELLEAIEQSQSLDPKEAARGYLKIQKLTAPVVAKEIGVDPNKNREDAALAEAMKTAVSELPELAKLVQNDADRQALNEIAESSPVLSALIETGNAKSIAIALVDAGKQLTARKQAAAEKAAADAKQAALDAKKKDIQSTVRSNAHLASADVVKPNSGSAASKLPLKQRLEEKFDRIVAAQK